MKSALAILKYLPAVLCGLLVVAWVVSLFVEFWFLYPTPYGSAIVVFTPGSLETWHIGGARQIALNHQVRNVTPARLWLGEFTMGFEYSWMSYPIPALLTLLLPLATGPFIRFRFPLWTWFAFTALVAVELAYYLR